MTVIGPSSKIQVALLFGILSVCIASSWGAARWATSLEYQVIAVGHEARSMGAELAELKSIVERRLGDNWTTRDMVNWTERLRELNPSVKTPAVSGH